MGLLHTVGRLIGDGARVGIDGVDGAGKTTFADALAASLGRPCVRVSIDDFHHVAAVRHARGRQSPSGFWADSFDHPRLRREVLEPLGPGGTRCYRPRGHDLMTDTVLDVPAQVAAPEAVLLLDGIFLQRPELAGCFELVVFLDVPFAETCARMAVRDGSDPDSASPSMRRYVEAQRRYLAAHDPRGRADVLIDNSDVANPRLVRVPVGL